MWPNQKQKKGYTSKTTVDCLHWQVPKNFLNWTPVFNHNGTDSLLLLMFGVSGDLAAKGATGTWLDGPKKLDQLSLTVDVLNKTV